MEGNDYRYVISEYNYQKQVFNESKVQWVQFRHAIVQRYIDL